MPVTPLGNPIGWSHQINLRVSGRLQLAGYGAECSTEISADQSERCNGRDRDQRGNQCVLDGGDARLILGKI